MPDVDSVREEEGAKDRFSSCPKDITPNLKIRPEKELLLTLKQAITAKQLELAGTRTS